MNITILGGSGQLGSELYDVLKDEHEVSKPSHNGLNIENDESIVDFLHMATPSVLINCVAYHDVAKCEADPSMAYKINYEVIRSMIVWCNAHSCKFVYISTDYVFDGTKSDYYDELDRPNPLNVYGKSKLMAEKYIVFNSSNFIIGRVSSLFGGNGMSNKGLNFVEKIVNAKESLSIVDDQVMSPTYARDAASLLINCINHDVSGIVHLNNSGKCSWYEFALAIKNMCDLDIDIVPSSITLYRGSYKAPLITPMSSHVVNARPWEDGLYDYLIHRGYIT